MTGIMRYGIIVIFVLVSISLVIGMASAQSVSRSISPSTVSPGDMVTVTLTPDEESWLAYVVYENLPDGVTVEEVDPQTILTRPEEGGDLTFKMSHVGGTPVRYALTVPEITGTYPIAGTWNTSGASGDINGDSIIQIVAGETEPGQPEKGKQTPSSPGYGAVLTLFSLGAVALLISRF